MSSSLSMTPAEEKGEEEEERMLQPALPSFDEKALVQFVTSRGGSVPPGLRVCERRAADERGRFAENGETSSSNLFYLAIDDETAGDAGARIRVPRESWLVAADGWRFAALMEAADMESRPWVELALRLLDEVRLGAASDYAPFLATLRFVDATPPCWTPLLEAEDAFTNGGADLSGVQMVQACFDYDSFVSGVWQEIADMYGVVGANRDAFPEEHFNESLFKWAFGVLRARTFAPLQADAIALVPLIDLATHDAAAGGWQKRRAGLLGGGEAVELVVSSPPGRSLQNEVSMSFDGNAAMRATTSQLALDYGVVEEVARQVACGRPGYRLTLGLDEDDAYLDDKLDVLEAEGFFGESATFLLTGGGDGGDALPPEGMLAYLRLVSLDGADAFLLEPVFRDKLWGFLQLPVSETNELSVCAGIVEGCKEALASIPNGLVPGSVVFDAADAERRAIMSALFWFESQASAASLGQLEYYQERRLKSLKLLDTEGKSTYDPFDDMTIA